MKKDFTADSKGFRDQVAWVARWVPARPTEPVWGGLRLEVRDGVLTLRAADRDVSAAAELAVDGEATGAALVSGRLLAALVATFPTTRPVRVEADDARLNLAAGPAVVTLPLMPVEDFPLPAPIRTATTVQVTGEGLARVVERVAPAAARENPMNAAMVYVQLSFTSHGLEAVAMDGRRAAWACCPSTISGSTGTALVPVDMLAEVARTLAQASTVAITTNASTVGFAGLDRTLVVRQAAVPYPAEAVRLALAWSPDTVALVPRLELREAVKRALVTRTDAELTALQWAPGELIVRAHSKASDVGVRDTLAVYFDGPPARVLVNPHYLSDALAGFDCPRVRVAFEPTLPHRPLAFTDPDDVTHKHVLVPIRDL